MFGAESEQPQGDAPTTDETASLEELRRLIVGEEREQLEHLERRLDDPRRQAEDISHIVAEALELRAARDQKLGEVLAPTIEESLRASVKRDPKNLVEAIFPVMGPAIRKAMADTLARMVQSLNHAMEHSLSPRSLRWRWQAWRTGKPFAEIVLLHTLRFRVEQVFLIHAETGLPLAHVQAEAIEARDGDMVSGMLTAIQDFVRDSFGGCEGEELDALNVGELAVWICRGPRAVVAAVIRGSAPLDLRGELEVCNEEIHRDLSEELARFSGEVHDFERSRPQLESCLKQEIRQAPRSRRPLIVAGLIAGSVLVLLGWWWVADLGERRRWLSLVERLRDEPGVVVASAHRDGQEYRITGLRDPLAIDPHTLVDEYGLDAARLVARWETFDAVNPEFVAVRSTVVLAPPESVRVAYADGVVHLSGTAPAEWLERACDGGLRIAGAHAIDCSQVVVSDPAAVVVADAARRLRPPSTVELSFEAGVLTARGSASRRWIERARVLAYTLEGIERFDDDDIDIADRVDALLRQADRLLDPPPSVAMSFDRGTLKLTGTAPMSWINRLEVLAGAIPEVDALDSTELITSDAERVLLASVRSATTAPESVTLTLDGTTVRAAGAAPRWWLEQAATRVRYVTGVAAFDTSGVVVTNTAPVPADVARAVLQPPSGVTLSFDDGAVVASGAAPQRWIEQARLLARTIPGASGLREDGLRSTDLTEILLRRAVVTLRPADEVTLRIDGTTLVASGQASHRWIAEARKLAPLIDGISGWREEALADQDIVELQAAAKRIEARRLYFDAGSAALSRGQQETVTVLASDLMALVRAATNCDHEVSVRVVGNAAVTRGQRARLSLERARAVMRLLNERGVPSDAMIAESAEASSTGGIAEARRVTFDVQWSKPGT